MHHRQTEPWCPGMVLNVIPQGTHSAMTEPTPGLIVPSSFTMISAGQ
jgi:hypothetical protein